jgi:cation/acetate symporter
MGIFSRKMNKEGAIAGMVAGIGFTLSYIIYFQFLGGTKAQYLFGISPEGIGFLGMIINFLVAFTVAKFTPAPPKEVTDLIDNVRYPGGKETAAQDH